MPDLPERNLVNLNLFADALKCSVVNNNKTIIFAGMKLNTVIFDMDGLLIDSEPLWAEAASQVFGEHGIVLTPEQYAVTTGLRTREFVQHWFRYFQLQDKGEDVAIKKIEKKVLELICSKGRPMPGVNYIVAFFKSRNFKIGLASSSGTELISQVINQLGLVEHIGSFTSAEFLAHGKPHPEVYLQCAQNLGARPEECICFEDSYHGMIAVKAARMKCVVVPSHTESQRMVWHSADLKISSLQNFNELLLYAL